MVLLPALYAGKALNPSSYSSSSDNISEDLFEKVEDDEEVIVYSGDSEDAVINQFGTVYTDNGEFMLTEDVFEELRQNADFLTGYGETVGLETEDGNDTGEYLYHGDAGEFDSEVDKYVEYSQLFDEFEDSLGGDNIQDLDNEYFERLKN